jgi:sulfite reductase beta subunit-like hemoprotein
MSLDESDIKESKVEKLKKASRHLRGTIAEELAQPTTHFADETTQLLKFHGTYQQDDRDERRELRAKGEEEAYSFMIRCAIPGGVLSAEQYLALDDLADRYAGGAMRITTRQGIQYHGVLKRDLKATIAEINAQLVTTLSACGDVQRNVMTCPAPLADRPHAMLRAIARRIAEELRPESRAYHEIWLDGKKELTTEDKEPFYGDAYLPRKFKSGISLAHDNCVDIYSYDAGLIAILDHDRLIGFNVVVGGGMGMTHNKADTFARLADPLGFVDPDHGVETIKTVAAIFRDFGNRGDRRHARLKYLMEEWGVEKFREEFRRRVSFPLHAWRDTPRPGFQDHLGHHDQPDGKCFYGVFVENGRIRDEDTRRVKTGLRDIVQRHRPGVVLTAQQSLLLTDLDPAAAGDVEGRLSDHGIRLMPQLSAARRFSMACPALPTCGLAMAESERLMPSVVDRFEELLDSLGLRDDPMTLRMTGCPNGCARPYTADIAFVGRRPDVYHVYVGGGLSGDRVADLFAADVPVADLTAALRPLLTAWSKQRKGDEGLSDFYQRLMHPGSPRRLITGAESPTRDLVQLEMPS